MRTGPDLRRLFPVLGLALGLHGVVAQGIISRNVSLDVGFGVPNLVFGRGIVKVSDHWQAGLGYGILPGLTSVGENLQLGQQHLTLGGTTDVTITPTLDVGFSMLLPFIRYFPRDNNFYIQATYAMLKVNAEVSGTMKTDDAVGASVGLLTGTASVTQPIPTLSVGHVWAGSVYFCDISIGFSFFLPASANIALNTLIPDTLGGTASNQAQIDALSAQMTDEINSSTLSYRNQFPVLPSLSFTFGIML